MNITTLNLTQLIVDKKTIDLMEINKFYSEQLYGKHIIFLFLILIGEFYTYLRLRFYFRTVMNPNVENVLMFCDDFFAFFKITMTIIILFTLKYDIYVWILISCFSLPIIFMDLTFYRRWIKSIIDKLKKK